MVKLVRRLNRSGMIEKAGAIGSVILILLLIVVLLNLEFNVSALTGASTMSMGCLGEGMLNLVALRGYVGPLLDGLSSGMGVVNGVIGAALEGIRGGLGFIVVIGVVIAVVGAALIFTGVGAPVGIGLIFLGLGIVTGASMGFKFTREMEANLDEIMIGVEEAFESFALSDEYMDADMVGRCATGKVLDRVPADVSVALAEEINLCLELGRESRAPFIICQDAIMITPPDDGTQQFFPHNQEDPNYIDFNVVDECTVTFMLAAFDGWTSKSKSNSACECFGGNCRPCCKHPGTLVETSGKKTILTQKGGNLLVWDPKLCKDGVINFNGVEDGDDPVGCIIEIYYGYDKRVHVRRVS